LPQLDQRAGDDVDESPGEFLERPTVAFVGELTGDARGYFGDPSEPTHRVVACTDVGPAEVENVELACATGALGLDVHPLEQVRGPLGVEDDHDLVFAGDLAVNVLGDEQLGEPGLAHARGPQDQGVTHALAQR